ncbi:MAG: hypothetical protein ACREPV_01165 [Lysobacter sp.]
MSKRTASPDTATTVPRETRYDGDDSVAVIWPESERRGLLRVGNFTPGIEYVVRPEVAIRLVEVKHFQYASPRDAEAAARHAEQLNAAALAPSPAAVATGEGGGFPLSKDEE